MVIVSGIGHGCVLGHGRGSASNCGGGHGMKVDKSFG